jgi:tRNA pseudouridine55 synthase
MLDADKVYEFTIGFGIETDTLDEEGAVVATSDRRPTLAEVEAVLPCFTGAIAQVPPAYSALKIDGERAYRRARAGEAVAPAARQVTVHSLKILPSMGRGTSQRLVEGLLSGPSQQHLFRHPGESRDLSSFGPRAEKGDPGFRRDDGASLEDTGLDEITLVARVSKGTYIRSLARDIARASSSVGRVTMLRRTRAGPFTLDGAISLDKLGERAKARSLEQALLPLTAGLDDIPALPVTPDQARLLRTGQTLVGIAAKPGLHLATDSSVPVALVEASEDELRPFIRVVRGFNL